MLSTGNDNICLLIKTFERKGSLIRLLCSLEKAGCRLSILIADDSKYPYKKEITGRFSSLDIQYYTLPFDSGLSAGRNALLEKTKTPFFLLFDDDFAWNNKTNLAAALKTMEEQQLDIGGGTFHNLPSGTTVKRLVRILLNPTLAWRYFNQIPLASAHIGNFVVENNNCTLAISNKQPEDSLFCSCDLVNNFFIGRTASIQKIGGWDVDLKVGEHEDFFLRAKLDGLRTAFLPGFVIKHYPVSDKNYLAFRERAVEFKTQFIQKFGFNSYREVNTDDGTIIFDYVVKNVKEPVA
ncbi:MAG: glycosyltransferase [Chitinophagales bacterium]|nr:glycosyltransferase [Chitinophagales bacterium]